MMDRVKWLWWRFRLWREMRRFGVYGWAWTASFSDYYLDEYTPKDALSEDMTYWDR